jgi:Zn finger protein HypA/HybF involved in hydrogenase expression
MAVPITHTDGCGMILPSLSKNNKMIRAPWLKGLLASFDFVKFIKKANEEQPEIDHAIITDIYGKKHHILNENIKIIFTKSQFKMYQFYDSWDEYKANYKKYNCKCGKCNEEKSNVKLARYNYQMLQTLHDLSDNELNRICSQTNDLIKNISSDRNTMLRVLHVNCNDDFRQTNFQKALELYPTLLSDIYTKEILKEIKRSVVQSARGGKLSIDGKYLFIIPDLYAFCEHLFLGIEEPKGLLKDGEVFCNEYNKRKKLDCLRSPHLGFEHVVRNNIINDLNKEWFHTKGLYTSCHDLISKVLMFDNDGDNALVCADNTIINAAERNSKNVVPLYYEMKKADPVFIDNQVIYNGLIAAYRGSNIGSISNDITKIWNQPNINYNIIKLLVAENNFSIDYAKTLYKPTRPKEISEQIISLTSQKLPYFFKYSKNKLSKQVAKRNDSVVNRLGLHITNPKMNFSNIHINKFDYKILMSDPEIEVNQEVIDLFKKLNTQNFYTINNIDDDDKYTYYFQNITDSMVSAFVDKVYVTDVLIKQLYKIEKSRFKETLWQCFGDIIVKNIEKNMINKKLSYCAQCGIEIVKRSNSQKYCESCFDIQRKLYNKTKQRIYRKRVQIEKTNKSDI